MTRDFWAGCLLIGTLIGTMAWAQAKPASPAAGPKRPAAAEQDDDDPKQPPPSAADVAADAPVLTIKGLCDQPTPAAGPNDAKAACQTTVSRAQFEQLVDALRAGKDAPAKRHLAKAYPQFLVMAHEAERRGLDKEPGFKQSLEFARIQILSRQLMVRIQEEAAEVPEKDIEDYYQKHSREFESADLERVVIPNRTQVKPQSNRQGAEQDNVENVMTKEAELLHTRAAAGEDFSKLQKQAYDAAGVSGNSSPNPKMDKLRRRGLPPGHASVFDLKPGQVSPVISDATGHYVYKLDRKGIESLDAVTREISNTLRAQRIRKMVRDLEQPFTTDVSEEYFGADISDESD